jgi:sigma-B regulation protein RsbU (phosphoserine phosphatase)
MKPAKDVGGDFYDCFVVDENKIAVVMADVSGKGVPAALFMMISRTLMKEHTLANDEPGRILASVNDLLCMDNDASMFTTAFIAVLDIKSNVLSYANAGHTRPVLLRAGHAEWLGMDKNFVLGGFEEIEFTQHEMEFTEGDCLILYTDGVDEAMNVKKEFFGDARLLELSSVLSAEEHTARETVEAIGGAVSDFVSDAEQSDDITVLAIRRTGTKGVTA